MPAISNTFGTEGPPLSDLLHQIEKAMGKKISGRNSEETVNALGGALSQYI